MHTFCELEPGEDMRPVAGYPWTLLRRHGRRPLGLRARTLLHADNRCVGLGLWSSLTILETAQGRLATSLRHICPDLPEATGGPDWRDAWLTATPGELRRHLFGHDPARAVPSHRLDAAPAFLAAWHGLLAAVLGIATDTP